MISRPAPCGQRTLRPCVAPDKGPNLRGRHGLPRLMEAELRDGLIMRDPYDVLGVAKSASEAEIKSAFRKLGKSTTPTKARSRGPRSASRKSARPTKSSAMTRSAKPSTVAKSTRKVSRERRSSRGSVLAANREEAAAATFAISASISAAAGFRLKAVRSIRTCCRNCSARPHARAQPANARRRHRRLGRSSLGDDRAWRFDSRRPADGKDA